MLCAAVLAHACGDIDDANLRDFAHYVQPKLGDKPLSEFNKFLLTTRLNAMAAANLSKPVVQRTKTLLSSIFIEAVDLGFLPSNPMTKVEMPKCKPTPKPVIEVEDVRRLYNAIPSLRDRLIFRIGVFLGPRASELFGFTVNDWKGDVLEIRNTAYNGTLRKAKVKTDGSRRTVPVPPDMRAMLKHWIEQNGLSGDDLIFPGRDGNSPLWPGVWMQKHLQRVSAGLKGGQSGRFRGEPHSRPVMPKAHHNLDRLNETTAVTGRVFFPPDMRLVHEQASRAVR